MDRLTEVVEHVIIHEHPVEWLVNQTAKYDLWVEKCRAGELEYCADDGSDFCDDVKNILFAIEVPDDVDTTLLLG